MFHAFEVFIGEAFMGDAVFFYCEPLITKPVNTSASARRVKYLLRFSVQHPVANGATVAIASLWTNTLVIY